MYSRRLAILIILGIVALLGVLLYASLRPSQLFHLSAAGPTSQGLELAEISSTLSSVSATAQAKAQALALQTRTLLQNPRYTGQDSLGRNWTLTADSAGQEGTATSGTYVLQQVQAEWADPSRTTPFTVKATQGRYNPAANEGKGALDLKGDVVATGDNLTLTAQEVQADLASRNLQATGGSRVTGMAGKWDVDIAAPNLTAENNGNRLLLTGGVRARLTPKGK